MDISQKVDFLPHSPGVYRFLNAEGEVIYVGKAKDLRRRVSQYFRPIETLDRKTRVMVGKIADLMHTVVETEEDALLLENNLIKQLQPRYNILLKDGKTYPWICIKKEPFPRVFSTRRVVKDGSLYFGPYSNVGYLNALLNLIGGLYQIRNCKLVLNKENIESGKYRKCLNAHLGKCKAPCEGLIDEVEYDQQIEAVKKLLKGEMSDIIKEYKALMKKCAANLEFEQAQIYKEKIQLLENHYAKSLIVNTSMPDMDVFSLIEDNEDAFCNFIRIKNGCIVQSFNMELKSKIEERPETLLSIFMAEIISKFGELSKEVLVPFMPDQTFEGKHITIPLKGDKASLLELSRKNAAALKVDKYKQEEHLHPDEHSNRLVLNLQKDLGMDKEPHHIECFDNSNIQGTNPVASCVVFKEGKPSKKDYRHFNIKTVVGANDFASMKEVVNRRYSKLLLEGESLPDLIVIDGGKGQLHAAYEALTELGLNNEIFIVGLAKRLEELIIPGDPYPLFLDKNSSSLKVLMQIRDEAHRFGITHHRNKRSKGQINSELRSISGVGENTEIKLIRHFRSVAKIKKATIEEISNVVGKSLGTKIFQYFHQNS